MKIHIYSRLIPMLLLAFLLSSCKKYLDIEPKGVQLLKTVHDYDQWLNSYEATTDLPESINLLADNTDLTNVDLPLDQVNERVFTWQAQFAEDQFAGEAVIWKDFYREIYYYNTVINKIDEAIDGTVAQKRSLKAEALLGRAYAYLYLVNLYGEPFAQAAAASDLAVPFVTSHDLNNATPPRKSVKEIYEFILGDLTAAIPDLPADNAKNRFRGSKAAGYAVLARTYQYMGNYIKAAESAQLALAVGPKAIMDFTTMTSAQQIGDLTVRPDVFYARVSRAYNQDKVPTIDFLKSFDKTDLRLKFYYSNLRDYSFPTRGVVKYRSQGVLGGTATISWGPTVAEMELIIAESAARANDIPTALDHLDALRKKRFPSDSYQKYISANQQEVLQKIMQERSFEFPYNGMRWIDMRRLNAEGKMPAVTRLDKNNNVIATLPPGDPRYTLQIPIQVMVFNPSWTQNP
ncbi:RagB/SusD family nutrient uptake outer membrane protein [Mucilaginibacter auburnensis]|uniref:SusD-like starch-binding protein associating with outer membrane n=1 Tax=Mucilaginibacter auburnensis TaxID=1457233 RepID=A0A2H9VW52_9SPHI|nr:RagB/SusD family nutrient uptake outer membrane protein [Mucilaginibacter auburnensis]PJJ85022.1 SusD-like starch-binding protein associating with outer membrane [Mucilaginibacter auburnensis]